MRILLHVVVWLVSLSLSAFAETGFGISVSFVFQS